MYTAYRDGKVFYSLALQNRGYYAIDPTISFRFNKAGSFTYSLPAMNPEYGNFQKLKSIITVEEDGELIWKGRVLDSTTDFYKNKEFVCEGELAFLNDALIPPYDHEEMGISVGDRMREYFKLYLQNCPVERKISLGNITAVSESDRVYPKSTEYRTILDDMLETIVDELGGQLVIRHENGESFLDYVRTEDESNVSDQTIRFGENLLDLSEHVDASSVYTYLIPLGKTDDEGNYLNISSVNDGSLYIKSELGEQMFGRIEKCIIWSNIEDAQTLKEAAEKELEEAIKEVTTLELNAVDMKALGVDVKRISVGMLVPVVSVPHGINDNFLCKEIDLDLQDESKTTYVIGGEATSITESYAKTVDTVNYVEEGYTVQLNIAKGLIEGKVSKGEFGSYVQQYYNRVLIGFNNNSKYVQITAGNIAIYDNGVSDSKKRAVFDESGNHFYRDGYYVGKIGTNQWHSNTSYKGLEFDLEYRGQYMSWSRKTSPDADIYESIFMYTRNNSMYGAEGLHVGIDFDFHNHIIKNPHFQKISVSGGGSAWYSGWTGSFQDNSGRTVSVIDGIVVSVF